MSGYVGDFSVPQGLHDMLQEFVVQCLIEKPEDLAAFAVEHFTKLRNSGKHGNVGEGIQATRPVAEANDNNIGAQKSTAIVNGAEDMADTTSDEEMVPPVRMPVRGRRRAVAAETYDPSKEDHDVKKVVHPKTEEQRSRLKHAMQNILLFKACEAEQIQDILDAMLERKVQKGDEVITQGDDGDNFYVIELGTYDVLINIAAGERKKVHTFVDSGSFGELALMYNCPRNATIIAQSEGILWALDQAVFRRIVVGAAARKRRSYESLLEGVPMLSELTDYERANLADALESTSFENHECIIQQGDSADCMYFVEDGYIRIVLGKGAESKEISVLKKGDYFGEMALVMNQPRSASVYAKGKAKCAKLDVGAFERLLGPCMEIMKRNIENYDSTRKAFGLE
ncbi:cAMP-dependent kinase type II regulatory subunit-like isoform X1 [Paramuricea clavata]|uniref:cAMP-dependent protein kinase type II regulatory subunit n=1 Tax=Paramuricea clavata TaxID=317549 RepID=A0A6S7I5N5_PARCT|nr:cAMP-dependent kinase type II regulatory subunit-like isoform X1 [Paramuricea clavata]